MKKSGLPKHVSYGPSRKVGPYIYFAKDGIRVTMPGRYPFDQSSAEFWAQYAKCLKGEAAANFSRRTIGELIKLYRASESFTNLCAGSTQKKYDSYLNRLNERAGTVLVKRFKKPDVINMKTAFKDKKPTGNNFLTVGQAVFKHGTEIGWIEINPFLGVAKYPDNADQRLPWTEDDIERIHAIAHPRESLVIELCIHTGQRIADVLNFRWDQIILSNQSGKRGTWVTQGKTGKKLFLPFTERLNKILDNAERVGEFIICNKLTGEQLEYPGIEQAIRKLRKTLGIKKTIHDLRHTAAHRLAEATKGNTELIQSITGHTNSAMVRRYANQTLQINQAVKAIDALNALDVL